MVTPIRPSLAQMLNGTSPGGNAPATQAAPPSAPQAGSFTSALAAQKSFFQQVVSGQVASGQAAASVPKITPPTFTAADVARGTSAAASVASDAPPKRPGSFLNIVV